MIKGGFGGDQYCDTTEQSRKGCILGPDLTSHYKKCRYKRLSITEVNGVSQVVVPDGKGGEVYKELRQGKREGVSGEIWFGGGREWVR